MEDILKYVMNTPGNTNYAVLKSILQNSSSGSGVEPLVIKINSDGVMDQLPETIYNAQEEGKPVIIDVGNSSDKVYFSGFLIDQTGGSLNGSLNHTFVTVLTSESIAMFLYVAPDLSSYPAYGTKIWEHFWENEGGNEENLNLNPSIKILCVWRQVRQTNLNKR